MMASTHIRTVFSTVVVHTTVYSKDYPHEGEIVLYIVYIYRQGLDRRRDAQCSTVVATPAGENGSLAIH